jgi:predicted transcriptional regulator
MENDKPKKEIQPLRNSDLIRDSRQLFIFKKTEKIVSAIFLISESFAHGVPQLSIQMREHAMNLLKKTLAVKSLIHFEVHEVESLIKDYLFLRSLFAVAHQTRLISDTNFSIVEFEMAGVLARLRSILETPLSDSQSDVLKKDFFTIDEMFSDSDSYANPESRKNFNEQSEWIEQSNQAERPEQPEQPEQFEHQFDMHHDQAEQEVSFIGHDLYKGHVKDNKDDIPVEPTKTRPQSNISHSTKKNNSSQKAPEDKDARLSIITRLLREKGKSSIKDIYDQFSGISEKTIQRDLQALVAKGTVKKEGEKRWSTYQISR